MSTKDLPEQSVWALPGSFCLYLFVSVVSLSFLERIFENYEDYTAPFLALARVLSLTILFIRVRSGVPTECGILEKV